MRCSCSVWKDVTTGRASQLLTLTWSAGLRPLFEGQSLKTVDRGRAGRPTNTNTRRWRDDALDANTGGSATTNFGCKRQAHSPTLSRRILSRLERGHFGL